MFMEVRGSILRRIFVGFLTLFCYKNCLKHAAKKRLTKSSIFHRFFVVFRSILGSILAPKIDQLRLKIATCCPKGPRDASGTNFDAPGRSFWDPRGPSWDSLGALWGHSGRLGRLFGPSWAHVGKQIAANGSRHQKTAAHSNRNQRVRLVWLVWLVLRVWLMWLVWLVWLLWLVLCGLSALCGLCVVSAISFALSIMFGSSWHVTRFPFIC